MRIRNIAYALILLNMPLSVLVVLLALSGVDRYMLMAHDLYMGFLGSFLGVLALSRLLKLESHLGKSTTITQVVSNITGQLIDDVNRLRKMNGEEPLPIKPKLNGNGHE